MASGKAKKIWKVCFTEDMNTLGMKEYMAHDRQLLKVVITHPTSR